MSWDYNKVEEDLEERNHQFAISFQRARKEAQIDEMIKNAGLYSLASEDGRSQLSFFPPVEKKSNKPENFKVGNSIKENEQDEENGI